MPNSQTSLWGNLTADPTVRVTQSGQSVASFTVAINEGKDRPPSFVDVTAWGTLGENAAGSLNKGDRVVVVGALRQNTWETAEGKRSKIEVVAECVGPDLRFAVASVSKMSNTETPQSNQPRFDGVQSIKESLGATEYKGEPF